MKKKFVLCTLIVIVACGCQSNNVAELNTTDVISETTIIESQSVTASDQSATAVNVFSEEESFEPTQPRESFTMTDIKLELPVQMIKIIDIPFSVPDGYIDVDGLEIAVEQWIGTSPDGIKCIIKHYWLTKGKEKSPNSAQVGQLTDYYNTESDPFRFEYCVGYDANGVSLASMRDDYVKNNDEKRLIFEYLGPHEYENSFLVDWSYRVSDFEDWHILLKAPSKTAEDLIPEVRRSMTLIEE